MKTKIIQVKEFTEIENLNSWLRNECADNIVEIQHKLYDADNFNLYTVIYKKEITING